MRTVDLRGAAVRGTAVVTGAGSGIGASCVTALAADGWSVVLAGRRREPLEAVAAAVGGLAVPTDVTDEDQVAVDAALRERACRP